jgi:lipopolysaccharide/colanic/teichoic acid biosynthesis glycosyltransferase
MYVGVVLVVLGLGKYHAGSIGKYDFTGTSRFAWSLAYIAILCLSAYGVGLPEVPRTLRTRVGTSIVAAASAALAVSIIQLFVGDSFLPRFVVFGTAVATVPWFSVCSTIAGAGRSALEERDRILVVGPLEFAEELRLELTTNPEKPASVVGHLTEEMAAGDRGAEPLYDLARARNASVLVLSSVAETDERIIDQAAALHESGLRVRTRSLFYEEWLGKIPVADLGRISLFFDIGEVHRLRYGRVRRVVDIVAGSVGVLVLILTIPFVIAGNAISNRGPLFYDQERVGRGGTTFRIYKFRSMRPDALAFSDWTTVDDPRITPFGRVLRRSHLDELPQVWNILRGDLSLVGPRPEQPHYVAILTEKLPYYEFRHMVRPGLTGWAQVKYGYAGDERDALEKLQYDFHYLRRQSLSFDLRILGRTIRSVVGSEGRGR